jgi:hypothetical protein
LVFFAMSKEKHHRDWILRRCCGSIAACILTLAVLVGFIVLVIYLALHPSKPSFYIQDLELHSIDLSDPALTLNLQVTNKQTIESWLSLDCSALLWQIIELN